MTHHFFTIDVEEYFQVVALEAAAPPEAWPTMPSRVERSTDRILALLDQHGATGTFFVLGWIAERHPELVRRIAAAGHEVASHGYGHRRVTMLSPEDFRTSIRRSKLVLEELTEQPVLGYRAPSFSIIPGLEWALDALIEEGYAYDSSLFPIRKPGAGYPAAPRHPFVLERPGGTLREFPPATLRCFGTNVPAGGGAWFRLLPFALTRAALKAAARTHQPATFYLHPWEIDPRQPRLRVPLATRIRHYGRLRSVEKRLHRLLREFRFTSIAHGMKVREETLSPVA